MPEFSQQLCWKCAKATNPPDNDCSWSKDLTPVKRWRAKKVKRVHNTVNGPVTYRSFEITKCPLFKEG